MDYSNVLDLIYKADLDNALEVNEKIKEIDPLRYLVLKSRIFELKGNYIEAQTLIDELLDETNRQNHPLMYAAYIQRSYIYYRLRDADIAKKFIKKAQKVQGKMDNKPGKYPYFESLMYNLLGNLELNSGELELALSFYNRSLAIKKTIGDEFGIADLYNNLGEVYRTKGAIESAHEFYTLSIEFSEKLNNQHFSAVPNLNLGMLENQRGNYFQALEYLKASYNNINFIRYPVLLGYILYQFVVINLRIANVGDAKGHLGDLEQLQSQIENEMIELMYKVSKATVLKEGNRAKEKVEAQQLYEEIVSHKVIDHEITVFAMMNLCQLLLQELKLYGEEEVFIDIKSYIGKLENIAKSQNSSKLMAETYLLQSQLLLIELKLDEANHLLTQAVTLADEAGFTNLALRISEEQDNLLENMKLWDNLRNSDASLIDRLDYVQFEEIVHNVMYRKLFEGIPSTPESPRLLLVINDGGMIRYKLNFEKDDQFNEVFIGAFITAINSFLVDAFSTESHIELIKYGNFKLGMKRKDKLLFCYVYEGNSYKATKNLDGMISYFADNNRIWTKLNSVYDELIPESEELDAGIVRVISQQ